MPLSVRRCCLSCERVCCTVAGWVPRVGVNALLVWGIYSHVFSICPAVVSNVLLRAAWIGWATVLYVLAAVSYFQTVWVGGGSPIDIPGFSIKLTSRNLDSYNPVALSSNLQAIDPADLPSPPEVLHNVTAKDNGLMRYCSKCLCWKPDRTHHCSGCRKCILRMDHHCPWFSTCIGFRNHKFFLLFLLYVSLFCLTCASSAAFAIYCYISDLIEFATPGQTVPDLLPVNWILLAVIATVLGIAVSCFTAYSWYLATTNTTVIESLEPVKYRTDLPSSQFLYSEPPNSQSVGNVFDLGAKRNLAQIMGVRPWMWFFPFPLHVPQEQPSNDIELQEREAMLNTSAHSTRINMGPPLVTGAVGDGTCFPINQEMIDRARELAQIEISKLEQRRRYKETQRQLLSESLDENDSLDFVPYHQQHLRTTLDSINESYPSNTNTYSRAIAAAQNAAHIGPATGHTPRLAPGELHTLAGSDRQRSEEIQDRGVEVQSAPGFSHTIRPSRYRH